jgi:hypothetical protein
VQISNKGKRLLLHKVGAASKKQAELKTHRLFWVKLLCNADRHMKLNFSHHVEFHIHYDHCPQLSIRETSGEHF